MKSLKTGLTQGWCLEPDELDKVATAWPHLETLMLGAEFASSHIPRIDHTHILDLLRRCPGLTSLGLRFDATRVGTRTRTLAQEEVGELGDANDTVVYGGPACGSRLRTLSVCDSPIYSPGRVIAFFGYHCRFLKTVNFFENSSDEGGDVLLCAYSERWEVVTSFFYSSWS
jgi:hypothetical protein